MYNFKKQDVVEITEANMDRIVDGKEYFARGSLAIVTNHNPHAIEIKQDSQSIYVNISHVKLYLPHSITESDILNTYYNVEGLGGEFIQEFSMTCAETLCMLDAHSVNQIADTIATYEENILYVCIDSNGIHFKVKDRNHLLDVYKLQPIEPFLRYCGFEDQDWLPEGADVDPLKYCTCLETRSLLSVTLGFHNTNCPVFNGAKS